jgi:acetyl-CoA acetyltransferase
LTTPFRESGCITACNASGVNDGAAALLVVSETMAKKQKLTPVVRIVGMATAGFEPKIMGYGPVPATRKLIILIRIPLDEIGVTQGAICNLHNVYQCRSRDFYVNRKSLSVIGKVLQLN